MLMLVLCLKGRGETECFISESRAKAFSLVLPVALLMLFNLIALGHTVVHIVETRKVIKSFIINN